MPALAIAAIVFACCLLWTAFGLWLARRLGILR